MFLNIFLIVAKIFETFDVFNNVDINFFEMLFVKELSFVKELTKNSIVRLN